MITSESNVQIKELSKLQKNHRHRKKTGSFLVEGLKLVREAARFGTLLRIYVSEELYGQMWQGKSEREIAEEFAEEGGMLQKESSIPQKENKVLHPERKSPAAEGCGLQVEIVSAPIFRKISDTVTPQGILGVVQMPSYLEKDFWASREGLYLLLDDIRDPGNLGTILRTAEGAGVTGVILSKGCADLFSPKTVRATMGSIFRLPFLCADDLAERVDLMKEQGISVYGTMMEGSEIYYQVDFRERTGIVIGNEANGISAAVAERLSGRIRIPMAGKTESLNAAVAAAVIVYEAARQRNVTGRPCV